MNDFENKLTAENITDSISEDLLIEGSPGNLIDGNPGLSLARKTLQKGCLVVLANKASLIFAFDELHKLRSRSTRNFICFFARCD